MLFCKANKTSISLLKNTFDIFSYWSGLDTNLAKSHIFFIGTCNEEKRNIARIMGFDIECLLIKYLGVPFIIIKLRKVDCKPLIDKILSHIL